MSQLTAAIFSQAIGLAEQISAAGVLACWEHVAGLDDLEQAGRRARLILVARDEKSRKQAEKYASQVVLAPKARLTRKAQIDLAVLSAAAQGLFGPGELLVCLAGPSGEGGADTIQVVEVGRSGPMPCSDCHDSLQGAVPAQVFNAVLNLAVELAQEGREGRPIGTIFVLGDSEMVLQFSRQAVLNPFAGYPEESLSIMSAEMKETIREFASLDGAFVIRGDGTLVAAGRQLSAGAMDLELPQGMGARHQAAAAISSVTKAVALVISESSGTVTIFHQGRIVASLVKEVTGVVADGAV